jgi:hypothetical protein
MIEKAIEKINAKMQKSPDDKYLEVVGEYIIDRVHDQRTAEAVLAEGKTLSGACDAIRAEARKNAKSSILSGTVGVIRDDEAFKIVDKYFGFDDAEHVPTASASSAPVLDLDLGDFL